MSVPPDQVAPDGGIPLSAFSPSGGALPAAPDAAPQGLTPDADGGIPLEQFAAYNQPPVAPAKTPGLAKLSAKENQKKPDIGADDAAVKSSLGMPTADAILNPYWAPPPAPDAVSRTVNDVAADVAHGALQVGRNLAEAPRGSANLLRKADIAGLKQAEKLPLDQDPAHRAVLEQRIAADQRAIAANKSANAQIEDFFGPGLEETNKQLQAYAKRYPTAAPWVNGVTNTGVALGTMMATGSVGGAAEAPELAAVSTPEGYIPRIMASAVRIAKSAPRGMKAASLVSANEAGNTYHEVVEHGGTDAQALRASVAAGSLGDILNGVAPGMEGKFMARLAAGLGYGVASTELQAATMNPLLPAEMRHDPNLRDFTLNGALQAVMFGVFGRASANEAALRASYQHLSMRAQAGSEPAQRMQSHIDQMMHATHGLTPAVMDAGAVGEQARQAVMNAPHADLYGNHQRYTSAYDAAQGVYADEASRQAYAKGVAASDTATNAGWARLEKLQRISTRAMQDAKAQAALPDILVHAKRTLDPASYNDLIDYLNMSPSVSGHALDANGNAADASPQRAHAVILESLAAGKLPPALHDELTQLRAQNGMPEPETPKAAAAPEATAPSAPTGELEHYFQQNPYPQAGRVLANAAKLQPDVRAQMAAWAQGRSPIEVDAAYKSAVAGEFPPEVHANGNENAGAPERPEVQAGEDHAGRPAEGAEAQPETKARGARTGQVAEGAGRREGPDAQGAEDRNAAGAKRAAEVSEAAGPVSARAAPVQTALDEAGVPAEAADVSPSGVVRIAADASPADAQKALDVAAADTGATNTEFDEPTPKEAEHGNYSKGGVRFASPDGDISVKIENPDGSVRRGDGWSRPLKGVHYGYIPGTRAADGYPLDVLLTHDAHDPKRTVAFINQHDLHTGDHDEMKVVMGARNRNEALQAYWRQHPKSDHLKLTPNGLGDVTMMSRRKAVEYIKSGHVDVPPHPVSGKPMFKLRQVVPVEIDTRVGNMAAAADTLKSLGKQHDLSGLTEDAGVYRGEVPRSALADLDSGLEKANVEVERTGQHPERGNRAPGKLEGKARRRAAEQPAGVRAKRGRQARGVPAKRSPPPQGIRFVPSDAPIFEEGTGGRIGAHPVSIVGIHYSPHEGLTELDPAEAGSGSAGGERKRYGTGNFGRSGDPMARMVHFYVKDGAKVPDKEAVVSGANKYEAVLNNLYDVKADPDGIVQHAEDQGYGANSDRILEEIHDAGYDGFVSAKPLPGQKARAASIIGVKGTVPVHELGASLRGEANDAHKVGIGEAPARRRVKLKEVAKSTKELLEKRLRSAPRRMFRIDEEHNGLRPSLYYELTPSPDDIEESGKFASLSPAGKKLYADYMNREVGADAIARDNPEAAKELFGKPDSIVYGHGGWRGSVGPSQRMVYPDGTSNDDLRRYAKNLSEIYNQQAVMAISDTLPDKHPIAEIRFDGADDPDKLQAVYGALYKSLGDEGAIGFSQLHDGIAIVNGDLPPDGAAADAWRLAVKTAIHALPKESDYNVKFSQDGVDFIGGSHDSYRAALRPGHEIEPWEKTIIDHSAHAYEAADAAFRAGAHADAQRGARLAGSSPAARSLRAKAIGDRARDAESDARRTRRVRADEEASAVALRHQGEVDAFVNDGVPLPDPHGGASKLDLKQWLQVRTPSFKAFGGDWQTRRDVSVLMDEHTGEPRVLYHETGALHEEPIMLHGFNPGVGLSRLGDARVPDGVFLKSTPRRVGVGTTHDDSVQMPAFVRSEKTLHARDKDDMLAKLGPEFTKRYQDIGDMADAGQAKVHDAVRTLAMRARAEGRRPTDTELNALSLAQRGVMNRVSVQAAKDQSDIAAELRKRGYDMVVLDADHGPDGQTITSYIALDPKNIKSAQFNTGAFDRTDPAIMYRKETFYSALARSIEGAKGAPKSADAAHWKQWLDGAQRRGEFRGGEREWSGIDDWLDKQPGNVSRADLLDEARRSAVDLKESLLSNENDEIMKAEAARHEAMENLQVASDQVREMIKGGLDHGPEYEAALEARASAERAVGAMNRRRVLASTSGVKYESWTTPGAKHYRELLLHVAHGALGAHDYRGPHFGTKNVLAHVRFDDRESPDGKKVLHIEEIQSDLHQRGRREGYATRSGTSDAETLRRLADEVDAAARKMRDEARDILADRSIKNPYSSPEMTAAHDAYNAVKQKAIEEAQRLMPGWRINPADVVSRLRDLANTSDRDKRPPDAPFKTEWPMLAFKRALRYATENGYDRVTWTTGAQQGDRYSLAHTVKRIIVDKAGNNKDLRIHFTDGTNASLFVNVRGEVNESSERLNLPPDANLTDVVGKELAQKIMESAGDGEVFDGDNLKIGAHGMQAFYDRMLPNEIGKYIKKWGGKVGTSSFGGEDRTDVHSIDITPAMRESVNEGQPLWRRSFSQVGEARVEQVRAAAEHTLSAFANRPELKVYASVKDAPPEVRDPIVETFGEHDGPDAYFDTSDGSMHVFADRNTNPETLERSVMHELAHYGLRRVIGPKMNRMLDEVYASVKNTPAFRRVAGDYKDVYAGDEGTHRAVTEEYVARLAEDMHNPTLWRKVADWFRGWARDAGLIHDWTDDDIRSMLRGMYQDLRNSRSSTSGELPARTTADFRDGLQRTEYNGNTRGTFTEDMNGDWRFDGDGVANAELWRTLVDGKPTLEADPDRLTTDGVKSLAAVAGEERSQLLIPDAHKAAVDASGYRYEETPDGLMLQVPALQPRMFAARNHALADPAVQDSIDRNIYYDQAPTSPWERLQSMLRKHDFRNAANDAKAYLIDAGAYIDKLERGVNGGNLFDATTSAYKLYWLSRNVRQIAMAVIRGGAPKFENGNYSYRDGSKGLVEVWKPLTDTPDGKSLMRLYGAYKMGLLAKRLLHEFNKDGTPKEKRIDEATADAWIKLGDEHPVFKQVFAGEQKFINDMYDFLTERGVLSKETADIWRANPYVPIRRIIEGKTSLADTDRRGVQDKIKSKARHGADYPMQDPNQALVDTTIWMLDHAYNNDAKRRVMALGELTGAVKRLPLNFVPDRVNIGDALNAMRQAGIEVDRSALTPEDVQKYMTVFKPVAPRGFNVESTVEGGKLVWWRVDDPHLLRAIHDMRAYTDANRDSVIRALSLPSKWVRWGVTMSPKFMVRIMFKDFVTQFGQTGTNPNMLRHLWSSAKMLWTDDRYIDQLRLNGYNGNEYYNVDEIAKYMDKLGHKDNVLNSTKKAYEAYRRIGWMSEQLSRTQVARHMLDRGGSPAEAAWQGQNALNWQKHGYGFAAKALMRMTPFLNAHIQGMVRIYDGMVGRDVTLNRGRAVASFAMKSMALALPTMVLEAENRNNEAYKRLPDYMKDAFWNVYVGGHHFTIPRPFEWGMLAATLPMRLMRLADGDDDRRAFATSLENMVFNEALTIPAPAFGMEAAEQWANKDWQTGAPIETASQQDQLPETRINANTELAARALGRATGTSPVRIQHFVQGFFAATGLTIMQVASSLMRATGNYPAKPAPRGGSWLMEAAQAPFGGAQANTETGDQYLDDFYDAQMLADQTVSSVNISITRGQLGEAQRIVQNNPAAFAGQHQLNQIAAQLKDLRRLQRTVESSTALTSEQKRSRLNEINFAQRQLIGQFEPFFKQILDDKKQLEH